MRLDTIKHMEAGQLNFETEWYGTKDFSKMGKKVDNMFPLLDPDLPFE